MGSVRHAECSFKLSSKSVAVCLVAQVPGHMDQKRHTLLAAAVLVLAVGACSIPAVYGRPDVAFGALALVAGGAVLVLYYASSSGSADRAAVVKIPAPPGARTVICAAQFLVPLACALSVLRPEEPVVAACLLRAYRPCAATTAAAVAVGGAGWLLFAVAKLTLGQSFTPCYASAVPAVLKVKGPYAWIRHPIYTANLALLLAAALMSGSVLVLLVTSALFATYCSAARFEEHALSAKFPDYRAYMAKTGRFLPSL